MDQRLDRLFQAATMGDVAELKALQKEDKLILKRVSLPPTAETPLHVASLAGHVDFVREMMKLEPSFLRELNKDGFAPIHMATAAGHSEVAKELLNKADSDLCLLKDRAGRTALHLAVIKGRVDIIDELLSKCPHQKAMEQVTLCQETVLHLAVKNSQFEAFKVLFEASEKLADHEGRLNAKDNEGKTVLEIANATNQLQVLHFLKHQSGQHCQAIKEIRLELSDFFKESWSMYLQDKNLLPVMATMIAAATFQAGLNPPSTIWEKGSHLDTKCIKTALTTRNIKDPLGLKTCPASGFWIFMACNTLAFAASLVLIPFRQHVMMAPILTIISLCTLFFAYLTSLGSISPSLSFFHFIYYVTAVSLSLLFYKPLEIMLYQFIRSRAVQKLIRCRALQKLIRSRRTNLQRAASSERRLQA